MGRGCKTAHRKFTNFFGKKLYKKRAHDDNSNMDDNATSAGTGGKK